MHMLWMSLKFMQQKFYQKSIRKWIQLHITKSSIFPMNQWNYLREYIEEVNQTYNFKCSGRCSEGWTDWQNDDRVEKEELSKYLGTLILSVTARNKQNQSIDNVGLANATTTVNTSQETMEYVMIAVGHLQGMMKSKCSA